MTTATIQTQAEALGNQLTAAGIRALSYLPDTFTPPCALVAVEKVDYHTAFGGQTSTTWTVFVIVSRADDRAGIQALEGFMSNTGTTSVRQALEADLSEGGVISQAWVKESGPPVALNVGGVAYITCPFSVETLD